MSLFQCSKCGCVENTALSGAGCTWVGLYDWSGLEEFKGKMLCSACGPTLFENGEPTGYGEWHGEFDRIFLPKGEWTTNKQGNLEHKITGITDYRKDEIKIKFT